ncbi:hypothetical protein F2P81_022535 [Scophthalmus maximus]|uniref:Uncharacterized protein n=1 Tax=Scophthalmus maximus TaxID=52904 RepID=A0A6A4S553_SCOMX|nr:hypothetical protein F2P81_022535 [Scophthalmus maximus]
MADQGLLLAVGVSLGLLTLLLLGLMTYYLWRRKKDQSPYEELPSTLPPVPACSAPVIQSGTQYSYLPPSGWYPVGTVLAGLYSELPPLSEVVAPPPGMATRLCFSVEYRRSGEQLAVTLFRLGNLPPRFHGNVTLVELRLLPDDRRPRQAKARGTGPDPEFNDCFVFQRRLRFVQQGATSAFASVSAAAVGSSECE